MSKKELQTLKKRINDIAGHIKEQESFSTTIHEYMSKRESRLRSNNFKNHHTISIRYGA